MTQIFHCSSKNSKKDSKCCSKLNAKMSMEDLILRDNTFIKPKDVIFEDIAHEPSDVTMAAMLNKCPVYS